MRNLHRQKGVTLIEALVAAIVLSIGILAVGRLQGTFVESGSQAKTRAVAMQLAQEKLDDLMSFSRIDAGTTAEFGFVEIVGDGGGADHHR